MAVLPIDSLFTYTYKYAHTHTPTVYKCSHHIISAHKTNKLNPEHTFSYVYSL